MKRIAPVLMLLAATALSGAAQAANPFGGFMAGDLVVSVEGNGVVGGTGSYTDNQAAPLTLFQYSHSGTASATFAGAKVLPQTAGGGGHGNNAISGEYGSSSEAQLQLTGDGHHLVIAGYGVNAAAFNANPGGFSISPSNRALGQSGSQTGQGYTAVPRVIALVGANGSVDTTTALTGVFNGNNPRSVYSANGSSFYVSGQGTSPDLTGGVFYTLKGASTAIAISGADTNGKTSNQDTRFVTVHDGQLYVASDSKEGSGSNRDFIGTLGPAGALPTSLANSGDGPAQLPGFGNNGGTGKVTLATLSDTNGINALNQEINLSPEDFFFANDTTLYVADSGAPKNNSVTNDKAGKGKPTPSTLGDGGLQKWSLVNGTWTLDYTLAAGLNLVANNAASGTTGLLGLTGEVIGGQVELFATNYTVGDTDPTFLYGITDNLGSTTVRPAGEAFVQLAAAPADSNFKGVAFAPTAEVPEPTTYAILIAGFGLVGWAMRRGRALLA